MRRATSAPAPASRRSTREPGKSFPHGDRRRPGEIFGSGTVRGGCGLEHLRFLSPGDVIELEVEGIGVLRNRVVRS
jgi:hypothetical protein